LRHAEDLVERRTDVVLLKPLEDVPLSNRVRWVANLALHRTSLVFWGIFCELAFSLSKVMGGGGLRSVFGFAVGGAPSGGGGGAAASESSVLSRVKKRGDIHALRREAGIKLCR